MAFRPNPCWLASIDHMPLIDPWLLKWTPEGEIVLFWEKLEPLDVE
jgi:hypothetical protein